jgi:hypothetical protein
MHRKRDLMKIYYIMRVTCAVELVRKATKYFDMSCHIIVQWKTEQKRPKQRRNRKLREQRVKNKRQENA